MSVIRDGKLIRGGQRKGAGRKAAPEIKTSTVLRSYLASKRELHLHRILRGNDLVSGGRWLLVFSKTRKCDTLECFRAPTFDTPGTNL